MSRHHADISIMGQTAQASLFRPEAGVPARMGVILFMDIFGPRPALYGMAQRIADAGHAVLLPDLFFRAGPRRAFDPATAMQEPASRDALMTLKARTPLAMTAEDTGHFIGTLRQQGISGPIAAVGYCMGGAHALTAAVAHPDAIGAAASFHGGGLADDSPDSPHLGAPRIRARVMVGSAGQDTSFPPEQAGRLAQALQAAQVDHLIEHYPRARHGWTVPDHRAYDHTEAERHWRRLLSFLAETAA